MLTQIAFFAWWAGAFGMVLALGLYIWIRRQPQGNEVMRGIADQIHTGAMAFLRREYMVVIPFLLVVGALLYTAVGERTGYAYVAGGLCSVIAGLAGMKAATRANVRTSEAARATGQERALRIAFDGGAVMGLSVASLGLIGIGVIFSWLVPAIVTADHWRGFSETIAGFAMGARPPTSGRTSSGRSRRAFPRTIHGIRRPSPTTWATTSAMSPAWVPTSSRATWAP